MNLFAHTLTEIAHGDLAEQASENLAELIKTAHATGKSGKLTLTIDIKPRGRDSGQVEVTGSVKPSCPIPDIAPSMFFITEDGGLAKENPRQMKLPFGEKDKAPRPVSKAVGE